MNQFDFEDAIKRGKRRGREAARRAVEKWKRPEMETVIGQIVSKVSNAPELRQMQNPATMREMEERYGTG